MKNVAILCFNLIFALICIASIAIYFAFPLWTVKLTVTVPGDEVEKMVQSYYENVELNGDIKESGIGIPISLNISSSLVINAVIENDAQKTVDTLIDNNVDNIANGISASLNEVSREIVTAVAVDQVKSEVKAQITSYLNPDEGETLYTSEEVQTLLDNANVTDEYIAEQVESVIDAIYAEGATVDSIADETVETAKDVYTKLKDSGQEEFSDLEFTEENEQSIRDSVTDLLNDLSDEDGNIDVNEFINTLISEALDSISNESASSAVVPLSAAPLADAAADNASNNLNDSVRNAISSYITEDVHAYLLYTFYGIAGLLAISLLSWLYLLIKIIIKLFFKHKAVKLKCPIILGWLPCLILMFAPTLAFWLMNVIPAASEALASVGFAAVSFSFFSSGLYACIAAVVLIILWIPYGRLRKQEKNA